MARVTAEMVLCVQGSKREKEGAGCRLGEDKTAEDESDNSGLTSQDRTLHMKNEKNETHI